ncbi:hypothetical protein KJ564_06715 [bacterium]|nr:hypothetical protein [bacterium]MBU1881387.1 hypothetical protein [bacterium]
MISGNAIFLIAILIAIFWILVWVYKKRHRLFFQSKFVAETTMMNYQDDHKRAAMEEVSYLKEETKEDKAGEGK